MLYPKRGIGVFLIQQRIKPADFGLARKRMAEIVEEDENLSADTLKYILGEELAQAYCEAYEKSLEPVSVGIEEPTEEVPHHSRRGLGFNQMPARTFL